MSRLTELKRIINLAENRRTTAIKRLHKYQDCGDSIKCDQAYAVIAYNNEIIANASNDLTRLSVA